MKERELFSTMPNILVDDFDFCNAMKRKEGVWYSILRIIVGASKYLHGHESKPSYICILLDLLPRYSVIIIPPAPPACRAPSVISIIILIITIPIAAPAPPARRDMALRSSLLFPGIRIQEPLHFILDTIQ